MKIGKSKKWLISLGLVVAIVLMSGVVNAAGTLYNYAFTVPVFTDQQTDPVLKVSSEWSAQVRASIVNGSLVAWIENKTGTNLTTKESYDGPCTVGPVYNNNNGANYYKGQYVRLNISTAPYQYSGVYTSGKWSPDFPYP